MFVFSFYLVLIGVLSVCVGSLGALVQVKIKRFLGYSSIGHSGYILLGIANNTINGSIAGFIYLLLYNLTILAFFVFLLNSNHIVSGKNICFFNQLYALFIFNREICFHLLAILFTMAAVPPFSSFFAKFYIYNVYVDNRDEAIL